MKHQFIKNSLRRKHEKVGIAEPIQNPRRNKVIFEFGNEVGEK